MKDKDTTAIIGADHPILGRIRCESHRFYEMSTPQVAFYNCV
jgi:hypothetical protein